MTMGDWLVQQGLDQPKGDRPKNPAAPSMNAVRRRQSAMLRAAATTSQPAGRLVRAQACCCCIVKPFPGMMCCWLETSPVFVLPGLCQFRCE